MYLGLFVVVVLRFKRDRALKMVMHSEEIVTLVLSFGQFFLAVLR